MRPDPAPPLILEIPVQVTLRHKVGGLNVKVRSGRGGFSNAGDRRDAEQRLLTRVNQYIERSQTEGLIINNEMYLPSDIKSVRPCGPITEVTE